MTASEPIARADTVVATLERPSTVSAYAGRLVWSAYDSSLRRYRLMARTGEVIEVLPVAPRSVPFDADVGPDPLGRPIVVYSRCRSEPRRGCDLFRFDFHRARETRIGAASTPGASEYLPSVWRGRIAYARTHEPRAGSRAQRPSLRVTSLVSRRDAVLAGGTRSMGPGAPLAGPIGLDLNGRRLAFTWQYSVAGSEGGPNTEVRVHTLGGRRILVDSQGNSDSIVSRVLSAPSLVGTTVFYALRTSGDSNGHRFRTYDLASGRRSFSLKDRRWLAGTTTDATATYAVYDGFDLCSSDDPDTPPTPCPVVQLDTIDYRPGFRPGP